MFTVVQSDAKNKDLILFGNNVYDLLCEVEGIFETLDLIDNEGRHQDLDTMRLTLLRLAKENREKVMSYITQIVDEAKGEGAAA